MSWQAVKAAFDLDLDDPVARLVVVALAYRAGAEGRAWPALARIAADTGYSRRTVTRALGRLADGGYLKVIHKPGRPSTYMLGGCQSDTGGGCHSDTGVVSQRHGGGVTLTPELVKEPVNELTPAAPPAQRTAGYTNGAWSGDHGPLWTELADGTWIRGTPDDPAVAACPYCDEGGFLRRGDGVARCSHRPRRRVSNLTVSDVLGEAPAP